MFFSVFRGLKSLFQSDLYWGKLTPRRLIWSKQQNVWVLRLLEVCSGWVFWPGTAKRLENKSTIRCGGLRSERFWSLGKSRSEMRKKTAVLILMWHNRVKRQQGGPFEGGCSVRHHAIVTLLKNRRIDRSRPPCRTYIPSNNTHLIFIAKWPEKHNRSSVWKESTDYGFRRLMTRDSLFLIHNVSTEKVFCLLNFSLR